MFHSTQNLFWKFNSNKSEFNFTNIFNYQLQHNLKRLKKTCFHLFDPPKQGGLFEKEGSFSHCSGVFATIDKACTPLANSSLKHSFTDRWRANNGFSLNQSETTTTLKCVSDPAGTLWFLLSLIMSKCMGLNFSDNFCWIAEAIDMLYLCTLRLNLRRLDCTDRTLLK